MYLLFSKYTPTLQFNFEVDPKISTPGNITRKLQKCIQDLPLIFRLCDPVRPGSPPTDGDCSLSCRDVLGYAQLGWSESF